MDNAFHIIRDWESDVHDVRIESCGVSEDPLGYRAVFSLAGSSQKESEIAFRIGASSLEQRARSLAQAGYTAPMTKKAIGLVQSQLKNNASSALAV